MSDYKFSGWGLPNQTEQERLDAEKRAILQLIESTPDRLIRHPAKEVKNQILFDKVKTLQQEDGIDDGFSFIHLEKAIFGRYLPYKPQLIGSCNPPTTYIRMADGSNKLIVDLKLYDKVLTAEGNIGYVTALMGREANEPMFNIKLRGHQGLQVTGEHPVLTKRGYVKASEITLDDYVRTPKYAPMENTFILTDSLVLRNGQSIRLSKSKPVGSRSVGTGGGTRERTNVPVYRTIPDVIHLTEKFGRLCGFYLAEGNADTNKLVFTFHIDEETTFGQEVKDIFKELFNVDAVISCSKSSNTCKVTLHSTVWTQVFKNLMGTGSGSKGLHSDIASGCKEFLEGLFSAWIDGDGYESGTLKLGTTISKRLAMDMFSIASKLDLTPHMNSSLQKPSRGVKTKQRHYNVTFRSTERTMQIEETDDAIWRKVIDITSEDYKGKVYNFEVSGDNSYVADGISVHNCTVAGTMVTMADGTKKPIEKIVPGDMVLSGEGVPRKVLTTFERKYTGNMYTISTDDGSDPLTMTADHKMAISQNLLEYSFKQPYEMTTEDSMITQTEHVCHFGGELKVKLSRCRTGYLTRIESIAVQWVEDVDVYDIEVDVDHSFFANGLCSSNCVASGSRIVDTQRMLAEIFLFNQAQDLFGNQFQGPESFQPFAPFNYRLGRAYVNLNGNQDGSLCSTHTRGKMQVGFLPCHARGLGQHTDFFPEPQVMATYRRWGANDTLVNQFRNQVIGKQTETEEIKNATDLKTVITEHQKPLMICSMWAFEATRDRIGNWTHNGSPVVLYRRSRQQWAHNMSLNGVVTVNGRDYVMVHNTWGDTFHSGRPWFPITLEEADRWLRNAEAMTVGDIELFEPKTPAII